MKNVDEALRIHFEEWFEQISRNRQSPPTIPKLPEKEAQELQAAWDKLGASSPPARRRGRPPAWDSSETNHSFAAALFVYGHMRTFRRRNLIKGVPAKARDAFLDIALRIYPKAKRQVVLEHIRENKQYGWDLVRE